MLLSVFAVLLSACTGVARISPDDLNIDKAYKLGADIRYGELNAKATLERTNANVWQITLNEPFALEGIVLEYNQGELTMSMDNLSSGAINENAVENAPYKQIIDSFENAVNGEGREIIVTGEEIKITSNSYELALNKNSLEPISLTMSGKNITVDFYEAQVSQIVQVILPPDNTLDNAAADVNQDEYDLIVY